VTYDKRRLLQQVADEVEERTGYRVTLIDYDHGVGMMVGNSGTSPWAPNDLRLYLMGFMSGVNAERMKGN